MASESSSGTGAGWRFSVRTSFERGCASEAFPIVDSLGVRWRLGSGGNKNGSSKESSGVVGVDAVRSGCAIKGEGACVDSSEEWEA